MSTPAAIASQLRNVLANGKVEAMTRVVLAGEAIAKREVSVKTGNTRRTITHRVEQGGNRGVVGTNSRVARLIQEGTKPHVIRAVRARALAWPGAAHPVRSVHHPGTRANPFLTRTAEQLRPVAERELANWGTSVLGSVK